MKKIKLKYHTKAKIKCSCGNIIETGSTVPEMEVEICSACHPAYSGKAKLVDAAGRVDKFKERLAKTQSLKKPKKKFTRRSLKGEGGPTKTKNDK